MKAGLLGGWLLADWCDCVVVSSLDGTAGAEGGPPLEIEAEHSLMWPLISSKAINAALKQRGNASSGVQPQTVKETSKGQAARVSGSNLPATGAGAGTFNTAPPAAPGAAVGRRPDGSATMPLHTGSGQPGSVVASSMSVAGSVQGSIQPAQNRTGYDLFPKGERENQVVLQGEIGPKHELAVFQS